MHLLVAWCLIQFRENITFIFIEFKNLINYFVFTGIEALKREKMRSSHGTDSLTLRRNVLPPSAG
jgi:hypothetical protein